MDKTHLLSFALITVGFVGISGSDQPMTFDYLHIWNSVGLINVRMEEKTEAINSLTEEAEDQESQQECLVTWNQVSQLQVDGDISKLGEPCKKGEQGEHYYQARDNNGFPKTIKLRPRTTNGGSVSWEFIPDEQNPGDN